MKNRFSFKPADFFLILTSLAAIAFSFIMIRHGKTEKKNIVVDTPDGKYIYPISKNDVYILKGKIGESKIKVKDGKVKFLDSPCPNKTCVGSGWKSANGDWAACLPNGVFVKIQGTENNERKLDSISG